MNNTFLIVQEMVANKLGVELASIKPESQLKDIGLDSLDTFDILFDAEERFGIKVDNNQVNVSSIQDVVNLFDQLLKEKAQTSHD